MKDTDLLVAGFLFNTNKEYSDAKDELEAVEYIKTNTDLSKPKLALKLYKKLTENRTFHTPVGYCFLKELQDTIKRAGVIAPEALENIYVLPHSGSATEEINVISLEHYKQLSETEHIKNRNSRIINIFLVLIILVMLAIAALSDKTIYSNFENEIINKYASWEEDLNKRQQQLDEREATLNGVDSETN